MVRVLIKEDVWIHQGNNRLNFHRPWMSKSVFLVDRVYTRDYGTAPRRQRAEVINRGTSRKCICADMSATDQESSVPDISELALAKSLLFV